MTFLFMESLVKFILNDVMNDKNSNLPNQILTFKQKPTKETENTTKYSSSGNKLFCFHIIKFMHLQVCMK